MKPPPPDPPERVLRETDLPEEIVARLRTVLDESGLDGAARADVAREFIAHFEDGLAAGRSLDELLGTFGEPRTAARLIARSKPSRTNRIMTRKSGLTSLLAALIRNIRYAVRRFLQSPGFTTTAILSLAVGIGANAAAFTLIETIVLRKQPYVDIDRLIEIYRSTDEFEYSTFSYPEYDALQRASGDVFADVAAMRLLFVRIDGRLDADMVGVEIVTGNYFPLLGLQAHLGRLIGPDDDVAPGAHPVVVVGYDYWRDRMGGDPQVLGTSLQISGRNYTVVGVTPPSYNGSLTGIEPALYASVMMVGALDPTGADDLQTIGNYSYFLRARLPPGVDPAQIRAAVPTLVSRLRDELAWPDDLSMSVVPTAKVIAFPPLDRFIRAAAWLLMSVVAVVLLVASANLASFLLARAVDRRREVSIRMALGASRRALLSQLLTETTLISVVGGAMGSILALGGLEALVRLDLPLPLPLDLNLRVTGRVFAFTAAVSVLTGLLFGLAPALHAARSDISVAMKPNHDTRGGACLPIRQVLVIGQVAVSLVLLVAAGLFVRSLLATRDVDVGFGYQPAAVVEIAFPGDRYDAERGRLFVEEVEREIARLPGAGAAGVIQRLHLNTLSTTFRTISVDGVEPPAGRNGFDIDHAIVDPDFFGATGIRILDGRNFGPGDRPDAPAVGLISQAMAERFWPDRNAIGEIYHEEGEPVRVIGVVSNTKVRTLGEAPRPLSYRPLSQRFASYLTIVASTSASAESLSRQLVDIVRRLDPSVYVVSQTTLARHIAVMLLPVHLAASAVGGFAALALVLAVVGLYGIVSYAVARRAREVGIRISIGAPRGRVVLLMMAGGLKLVVIGGLIGLALALASARVLSSLLFGIPALDPITFVAVPLVLGIAALAAAYFPARRASRIDPVRALKID